MPKTVWTIGIAVGLAVFFGIARGAVESQTAGEVIAVDSDDVAGRVAGPSGPEAGVWVIAETRDLPTPLAKIVVTDDQGRYLIPDLPAATYDVWVRGYGLVDSPKTRTTRGKNLNLRAVPASSPLAAAQYYPAAHWLSLMEMPAKAEFPGTGDSGNGISPNIKSQGDWIQRVKSGGCTACHALGTKATREVPTALGPFSTTVAAWDRRLKSGQAGAQMSQGWMNLVANLPTAQDPAAWAAGLPMDASRVAQVQADGLAYLHQLASSTPSAANVRRYAEIVRERAIVR